MDNRADNWGDNQADNQADNWADNWADDVHYKKLLLFLKKRSKMLSLISFSRNLTECLG